MDIRRALKQDGPDYQETLMPPSHTRMARRTSSKENNTGGTSVERWTATIPKIFPKVSLVFQIMLMLLWFGAAMERSTSSKVCDIYLCWMFRAGYKWFWLLPVGSKFWRFDPNQRPPVKNSYPKPLSNWEGIPDNIDAAFQYTNGYTYFFKKGAYYRFNDRMFAVSDLRAFCPWTVWLTWQYSFVGWPCRPTIPQVHCVVVDWMQERTEGNDR